MAGCIPMSPAPGGSRARHVSKPASDRGHRQTPDAPNLKRLRNGHYRVREPWTVKLDGRVWHVPAGYTSNGITAPAKLKSSMGDGVKYSTTWAAVFHDWLFTQPGVSRAEADRTFYQLLLAYGVPQQKAMLMYTTVSAYSLSKSFR